METPHTPPQTRHLALAGILLGLGLGGFFDGIVFHQLLRWHHLVCSTDTCLPHTVANYEQRAFQDGLFHALCWLLTTAGLLRLATARTRLPAARPILGYTTLGWGLFNLVEGTIDHLLLGIHHVRPASPHYLLWDLTFLAWGALFIATGYLLARPPRPDNGPPTTDNGPSGPPAFQTP